MIETRITNLIDKLDGSGSDEEFDAVHKLQKMSEFPKLLLKKYHSSKDWRARSSCVYHAIKYARYNDDAFLIGIEALNDRSKFVIYRACMLLAYSLNENALKPLAAAIDRQTKREIVEDLEAAFDAITSGNHNFFIDREHSGKMFLTVPD